MPADLLSILSMLWHSIPRRSLSSSLFIRLFELSCLFSLFSLFGKAIINLFITVLLPISSRVLMVTTQMSSMVKILLRLLLFLCSLPSMLKVINSTPGL